MDPDSDFAKAWKHMEKYRDEVMVMENDDGVAKAQKERYAFFMETTSIEYEIQRKCDLDQVGNKLDEKSYGIAMKKSKNYSTYFILTLLAFCIGLDFAIDNRNNSLIAYLYFYFQQDYCSRFDISS